MTKKSTSMSGLELGEKLLRAIKEMKSGNAARVIHISADSIVRSVQDGPVAKSGDPGISNKEPHE